MDWEKTYIFTSSPILCDKSMRQGFRDPQARDIVNPSSQPHRWRPYAEGHTSS